ncbi:MAG TPA: transposase [bacterium]|nr:transposase [bacterium]
MVRRVSRCYPRGRRGGTVPRRPRGLIVQAFVHVAARGNRGFPLYLHQRDFESFLGRLEQYAAAGSARVHAYCLMTNHLHLLLEAGQSPISKCMQSLLARYAEYVNRRYQYRGHLFGGRFWSKVCLSDEYFLAVLRYIHRNPVRAGLVTNPEEYPWSSHRVYLGTLSVPWVTTKCLELFSLDKHRAIERYARFVSTGGEAHRQEGSADEDRPRWG